MNPPAVPGSYRARCQTGAGYVCVIASVGAESEHFDSDRYLLIHCPAIRQSSSLTNGSGRTDGHRLIVDTGTSHGCARTIRGL